MFRLSWVAFLKARFTITWSGVTLLPCVNVISISTDQILNFYERIFEAMWPKGKATPCSFNIDAANVKPGNSTPSKHVSDDHMGIGPKHFDGYFEWLKTTRTTAAAEPDALSPCVIEYGVGILPDTTASQVKNSLHSRSVPANWESTTVTPALRKTTNKFYPSALISTF